MRFLVLFARGPRSCTTNWTTNRRHVPRRRARRGRHRPRLRRDQRTNDRTPIQQASPTGAPLFSRASISSRPAQTAVIDATDLGHPIASLRDLPAGTYWVQPFVNVYTKFARADGHTVWLHMDQWEGQNWKTSPGNLFGDPVQIKIDPRRTRRSSSSPTKSSRRFRCRPTPRRSSASRSRATS